MTELKTLVRTEMDRAGEPAFGIGDVADRRDRRRRNQRLTAGVIGIAVFVAAVWFVTTGGPFDRDVTPGASGGSVAPTGPTAAAEYPGQVGIVGIPPEGAIPSSPSRGELAVSAGFAHTSGDPGLFVLNVYADGRLIWHRLGDLTPDSDEPPTGWIEQKLSPEGIELIRSEVLSTGLFERDAHFVGAGLPYTAGIEVRDGDSLVGITWGLITPEEDRIGPERIATPEQVDTLLRLRARMEDLASWLPASAWEDQELRPYVASRHLVCYVAEQGIGADRALASLPPRAGDMLRPLERTHGAYGDDSWCSIVTTEQGRAFAGVLDEAGFGITNRDNWLKYEPRDPDAVVDSVSIEPLLPHEG
jgi:hypothetical protein